MPLALAPAPPDDRKLTLSLPQSWCRHLRDRMAHEETTLRALMLEALMQVRLCRAGSEIRDRRRRGRTAA